MIAKNLWILSPKKDLIFLIGCCVLTPLAYLAYSFLTPLEGRLNLEQGAIVLILWAIFDTLFDSPHILRTFARTHFDTQEFRRHQWLHTYGFMGLIIMGLTLVHFHYEQELYFAVAVIGSWHIFKQNIGFLKVYNAKAKIHSIYRKIDLLFFYSLYFYYLTAFLKNDQIPVWKNLKPHFESYSHPIEQVSLLIFISASSLFIISTLKCLKDKKWSLSPKLLFLSSITLTYLFIRQIVPICPLLIIIIAETIYHDVQYQAWMNFYQEKRFQKNMPFLNKWFLISLLYGLIYLAMDLIDLDLSYLITAGFMIILYHYIVDGFIWKFSKQEELKSLTNG